MYYLYKVKHIISLVNLSSWIKETLESEIATKKVTNWQQ